MLSHTNNNDRAIITSSRLFFRSRGAAVGVAVSSAVLQANFKQALPQQYKYPSGSLYSLVRFHGGVRSAVTPAYGEAIRNVFMTKAAVALVGGICCSGWKDIGCDEKAEGRTDGVQDEAPVGTSRGAAIELSSLSGQPTSRF
ncbi:hypothetical protein KCU71_g759, partial [Aureobasidium melanogenum]